MDQSKIDRETQIYIDNPEKLYGKEFFKRRPWQINVGECLAKTIGYSSIVDFGCANGLYLFGAYKFGVKNICGFEYMYENAKDYIPDEIKSKIYFGNVMENINCGKFDCSMSIEVAEHILPEKSEVMVSNLTRASNKYILFTAAPVGQGGTGHINERPREFWIDKISCEGFKLSYDLTETCKKCFAMCTTPKYRKVLVRNLMVFEKQ